MGCVSSKLVKKEIEQENLPNNGDSPNHVVSLTSSTYGVLKLDKENHQPLFQEKELQESPAEAKESPPREEEPSEIINAWELMEGLEEEGPASVRSKKSPKSRVFLRGFAEIDGRRGSPLKFLNQMGSPRKFKKFGGKENKERSTRSADNSPRTVLKECNVLKENSRKLPSPRLWASIKGSPNAPKVNGLKVDSDMVSSRRSLGPLFKPEPVASAEKVTHKEEEKVKKMVSPKSLLRKWKNSRESESLLESFEEKCPPDGENLIVIYTTTLRGIRKTFEDCNIARSIIESHMVRMFERDISMHLRFKEEIRGLLGTKDVKVPLVFVKGRLIGGADEMVKLEEEGKLGILFAGIPRAAARCRRCGGVRFVMCVRCNGSCKVLDEKEKKSVKCSECNENGLIQCPMCC